MPEALWLIAAALICFLGMSWLALAMKVHWQQLYQDEHSPAQSKRLRTMGSAALIVSGLCCLQADHASMAVLVWVMLLAGSAVSVAMILARQPLLLRWVYPQSTLTLR